MENLSNLYAPPNASADSKQEAEPAIPLRRYRTGFLLLGASIMTLFLAVTVGGALQWLMFIVLGSLVAAAIAVVGLVRGIVSLARTREGVGATALAMVGNLIMAALGAFTALFALAGFARGRQLRRFGHILLPPVKPGYSWARATSTLAVPETIRGALATEWRENGRTEHASVAAFARLTLDLMALGAPPELVAGANRDALDEIRHAELCFSLARAIDGVSSSPGPFPEAQRAHTLPRSRKLALAKLAVDSLVDGALHEGVSARVISKLAKRCEEPRIRAVLKELAADEGRHAAHGWDVVDWCVAEGGHAVVEALLGAVRVVPDHMQSPRPDGARDGAWERWGIHGHALEAEEYAAARAHIAGRVQELAASKERAIAAIAS